MRCSRDVTIVANTTPLAYVLKATSVDDCYYNQDNNCHDSCECGSICGDNNQSIINPDYETIIRMLKNTQEVNRHQECVITQLLESINKLAVSVDKIQSQINSTTTPSTPLDPPDHTGDGSNTDPDDNPSGSTNTDNPPQDNNEENDNNDPDESNQDEKDPDKDPDENPDQNTDETPTENDTGNNDGVENQDETPVG